MANLLSVGSPTSTNSGCKLSYGDDKKYGIARAIYAIGNCCWLVPVAAATLTSFANFMPAWSTSSPTTYKKLDAKP